MAVSTPPAPSGVSPATVEKAISSLLKWRSTKSETQKPQLIEQDEFVYLILTLKKIPQKGTSRTNARKIPLSHPLIDFQHDNPELCLVIDDRPKSGLTKDDTKKKIQNDNIPISKIIKLSKLKTDYRPFEAKRKLCDSYEMFFADKRVIPLLPKMLGKQFFKKKKIPVGVDLKHKNWKEQIEKACGSGLLYLRTGTCSVMKVGRVSMGIKEIVENVVAAIDGIAEIVPRKWSGIRSFHLKLLESLALPVYQALPDLKLKIESGIVNANEEEAAVEKEAVKEDKVGKKKKKGRIHEVRYMDNDVNGGQVENEDVLGGHGEGNMEHNDDKDDDDYDAEMGGDELEGKKRKKGDNELGENGKKKAAKLKKDGSVKQKKEKEKLKKVDGITQKKSDNIKKTKKKLSAV